MSNCLWNEVNVNWGIYYQLWYDVEPCIHKIGHGKTRKQRYNAYKKSAEDKDTKEKLIKLILIIKGKKIEEIKKIDIEKYNVTIDDVELLIEEYKKLKKEMRITANDIKVINE